MNRRERRATRKRADKLLRRALWRAWLRDCSDGGTVKWLDAVSRAEVR
jgi:hypothetical protein